MRHVALFTALVLGMFLATSSPIHAYDFSPEERALADNPPYTGGSSSSSSDQWYRDHQQQIDRLQQEQNRAARQSQENDRLSHSLHQSNPQGAPGGGVQQSMPWSATGTDGRATVCYRGFNNSVTCF